MYKTSEFPLTVFLKGRTEHTRKRRMLANAYSQKAIVRYEAIVANKVQRMLTEFDKFCTDAPRGNYHFSDDETRLDYRNFANYFTYEVIADIGLSEDLKFIPNHSDEATAETIDGQLYKAHAAESLHEGTKISATFAWSPSWYTFNNKWTQFHPGWAHGNAFTDIVIHLVRRRLERESKGEELDDFVSVLLRDADGVPRGLPFGEIEAECNIMMNAGNDTTAIQLTNALNLLIQHPRVMAKLRAELDSVDSDEDIFPYEKVKNLPYLKACLDESLRLHPPTGAGMPRLTPPEGMTILGEYIPGNTTVSIAAYTAHRDPKVWHHPDEYLPERWLEEDAKDLQKYYIPFSAGGRGCIGRNISYLEQQVLIGTLCKRYNFAFKHPDWELEQVEGLNKWPGPMPLKIWRR
jgi:cytochrome P450